MFKLYRHELAIHFSYSTRLLFPYPIRLACVGWYSLLSPGHQRSFPKNKPDGGAHIKTMFCALTDVGVEEQKHCDGFLFCWLVLLVLNESTSVMAMRRPPVVPRVPKGLQRSVAQRLSLSPFFASIRQKAILLRRICMLRICMNFISRNNSRIEHTTAPGGQYRVGFSSGYLYTVGCQARQKTSVHYGRFHRSFGITMAGQAFANKNSRF